VKQAIAEHEVASAGAVSDADLAGWFPDGRRRVSDEYEQPDLARVLASMKQNRHFTLLQAWRRYADTNSAGKKNYGYSQFCAVFADYVRTHDLVATLRHERGRAMLVDWAGDTIDLVDVVTGVVHEHQPGAGTTAHGTPIPRHVQRSAASIDKLPRVRNQATRNWH